tara:strand:+ start:399 stop:605 length:207 start_codon:yes stop_codon:yes gene_type:complete
MEEINATIVPLGSLAILFALFSIIIFIIKASIARQTDVYIKKKMNSKKQEQQESLEEQKRRLEILLRK